ncbi:Nucleoid-associated protein YgaU, contains BON and LysM domains [Methylorubrum salsuginis]|uniref:Nucleoid-associated protein YgaU, contains BON and LysM domains n=1 Tax=Methylorubrum salsuginis TaxID=414703 RepID=A0A1I4J650_9HYPH|nr:Nucleoid-associated protein YgaU, contains BON and LysM domains [Methylorubrum salsuginis]
MRAEVRRGIVLAVAGLLGGFAMVVALFGTGELLKRNATGGSSEPPAEAPAGSDKAAPLAALTPPPQGKTPGAGPDAARPQEAAPTDADGAPTFDIVRVEPDGASVVAGRTVPNAKVELLRDGKAFASVTADAAGQFALTPPDLPTGSSEIALRAVAPDGKPLPGRESVTVVVSEKRGTKPLIALSAPDAPTRVLSQPDAPEAGTGRPATAFAESSGKAAPGPSSDGTKAADRKAPVRGEGDAADAAAPIREAARPSANQDQPASGAAESAPRIVSIDAQDGGRLDVTAQAPADSTLRLYLNDTLVASGRTGADGRIAFTIGRGVRPGSYQVRVDSVDPAGGKVRRRAEVAFTYPESTARVAAAEKPAAEAPAPRKNGEGKRTESKPADRKPAAEVATPSAKAPTDAANEPKTGPSAAKPDVKPASPKTSETQAGASPMDQTPPQAKRPDPRPAETDAGRTAPSASAPAKASPMPETRTAPSLAGDPAIAPPPAAPSPGTVAPGTPSVAAGTGIGTPNPAADGAAAAALAPKLPEAGRTAEAPGQRAGTVFVPEISTARITRGDSLWQISRRTYGKGNRYTVIYDANQDQIRDPDLIYPGQIFVLPKDAPAAADNPAPKKT